MCDVNICLGFFIYMQFFRGLTKSLQNSFMAATGKYSWSFTTSHGKLAKGESSKESD